MIALSLALAAAIAAQQPPQKPLSAGAVLLLSNAKDPSTTSDALQAALLSADASTRLAAARVIAVVPHVELRGALFGAIAREQNAVVGGEMIRDLLLLSGAADVGILAPQVRRFGGGAVFVLAEWLAREDVDQFIARHDELAAVDGVWRNGIARVAAMAALQHPADAARIQAAWPAGNAAGATDARAAASGGVPAVRQWEAVAARASILGSIGPGLIESTLKEAKCTLDRGDTAVVDLIYASDGRPAKITADPRTLSPSCWSAWTALARTAIARPQQPAVPGAIETVVLPLDSQVVQCIDDSDVEHPGTAIPKVLSGTLKPPRKTKDVPPVYPPAAQRAGVQGSVLIDAMISKRGCVVGARVIHSIPGLDIPALNAVSRWLFEPLTVEGNAVPVVMTVTVSFTLR